MAQELSYYGNTGGGGDTDSVNPGGAGYIAALAALVQAGTSVYNTRQTNKANKQMAQYQFDTNLEMWNKANAYNSPENQRLLLEKAGLNPNLLYGHGTQASKGAELPKYNAPTMQYNYDPAIGTVPTVIGMFQDMKIKQATYDNLKEQRLATQQQRMLNSVRTDIGAQDLTFKTSTNINRQLSEAWKQELLHQKQHWGSQLLETQLQGMQTANRARETGINKTMMDMQRIGQQTEKLKLENEYFEAKILADFGGKILGGVKAAQSLFKGGRNVGKSYQIPGKSVNQASRDFNETTRRLKDFKY